MGQFQKGHEFVGGSRKGIKNLLPNSVKQMILQAIEDLGATQMVDDGKGGQRPMTSREVFLLWVKDNQESFWTKMAIKLVPTKVELEDDPELHENFLDGLVFADEQGKLKNTKAVDVTDVGNEDQKQLPSGDEDSTDNPNLV